jgi:hypothetical protein
MRHVEWSDYLGNSASALEIVQQAGCANMPTLAEYCEEQHNDIWPDEPVVEWDDVAASLVHDAAKERVRRDGLDGFNEVIFYEWSERDHLLWIATAPLVELRSWAEATQAAQNERSACPDAGGSPSAARQ